MDQNHIVLIKKNDYENSINLKSKIEMMQKKKTRNRMIRNFD